jgi:hypothetical protein
MNDAQDYAGLLQQAVQRTLEQSGHRDCQHLARAQYEAATGMAVCGCGSYVRHDADSEPGGPVVPLAGTLEYGPHDPLDSALPLIDPSEVYTPEQVERHILDVLYRLETGAKYERECVKRAHQAVDAWDRAFYKAIHSSSATSADRRKAEAMVACDDAGLTAEKAEALMMRDAVKATMHNLRAVLSGYQSTARSVGVAYQAGGSPAGRY